MEVVPYVRIPRGKGARSLAATSITKQQSLGWKRAIIRTQLCWQQLPVFRTKGENTLFKPPKSLAFYYGSVYKSAILNYSKAPKAIKLFWFMVLGVPLQDQLSPL